MLGFLIGSAIWFGLSLFILIPFAGVIIALFIAPIVGGYAAGKYGGGVSVLLLALFIPLVIGLLGFSVLRMLGASSLGPPLILGLGLLVLVPLWALLNVFFVGIGGAVAIGLRKAEQVQVSVVESPQHFAGPAYTVAPSQPQVQSTLRYCIHCGARSITQNTVFCPICGRTQP